MTDLSPSSLCRLRRPDQGAAAELARQAGVTGIYVANALLAGDDGTADLRALRAPGGAIRTLCWVGRRGNLVVLGELPDDPALLAAELLGLDSAWRIALAPRVLVDAICLRDFRPPLVCRTQVFHAARAGADASDEVRPAVREDLAALCEAAIELNEYDLRVPRARVHLGWLQKTVRRRLRDGRTFVIGPRGAPQCKLDVGSRGPAGAVIEGVFTFPASRGLGLATRLCRTVVTQLLTTHPVVCLHVDVDNARARAVYEAAGMHAECECGIILRDG